MPLGDAHLAPPVKSSRAGFRVGMFLSSGLGVIVIVFL